MASRSDVMRILGIDPGATIAWCLLETQGNRLPRYLGADTWRAEEIVDVARRMRAAEIPWRAGDVVAIERAKEIHPASIQAIVRGSKGGAAALSAKVRELLRATWIGGRISAQVEAAGGRVIEVDAAEARRALGVRIGGRRRGEPCGACSGSGADVSTGADASAAGETGARLLAAIGRPGKGRRAARVALAALRLDSAIRWPCTACGGAGELGAPTVDQQVAKLLPGAIAGWPERSNVHVRDAGVTAWFAARANSGGSES